MDKPRPFLFKYSLFSAISDELSEAIDDEQREIEAGEGTGQVGFKPADSAFRRSTRHPSAVPQNRLSDFWRHRAAGLHRLLSDTGPGPDAGGFGGIGHGLFLRGCAA